jgi:glycogen operon protein
MTSLDVHPGEPWPLGPHACHDGTNFAVFSRHAVQIELWVFESAGGRAPPLRVPLDPARHRTGDIWHVRVRADLSGRGYAFRATGPALAEARQWFDPRRLLLDPYASRIAEWSGPVALSVEGLTAGVFTPAFAAVAGGDSFDWQGVSSPRHAWADTVIYETHVRGLTQHASSGVQHRGQYLGVIEKIPYLRALGITAVELLPVQAFAACGLQDRSGTPRPRVDYWGYNPIALFAPHPAYASGEHLDSPLTELRTMVRELHRAGIEVILDVVFNHTGEAGRDGPVYSFRGLDNAIYYLLTPEGSGYLDYTGCGNTLNCNHPVVRSMIVDCLRHWVVHLHVDGFRFDLAAVLGRGENGAVLANPPVLEQIAEDPILRNVKLIAEAWDSGGAFEVGRFAGARWGEWNCHFRDDVRRFWRGDPGLSGAFASRLCGSADLYQHDGQTPVKSINFITSHDGFTLHDLVSYAVKHNEPNGEDNRDGMNQNFSANHGVEGPTREPAILELRGRQMKNLLATLLLARGVPMLLGGDEFGRSQSGNNNAYCQDNEISWYDWSLTDGRAGLVRFVQGLIGLRRSHAVLRTERFYTAEEIEWLGPFGRSPAWQGPENRIGCVVRSEGTMLALLFNASLEPCEFALPNTAQGQWRVCIDTARASPEDAPDEALARKIPGTGPAPVAARSTLMLQGL